MPRRRAAPWLAALGALLLAAPAHARDWPRPTGHFNDLAHAVEPAYRDSIEAIAREVRETIGSQIAVLVTPDLGGENVDAAAEEVYRQWEVGRKGKDDGVLILLTVAERKVRIEVGYGLEGILPDGRVGWIIRNVMGPDLRQNRFGAGLLRGTEAVAAIIAKDAGVTLTRPGAVEVPAVGVGPKAGGLGVLLFILFLIIVMSAITSRHRRTRGWGDWRTRRRRGWYDPWGGFGGGLGGLGGFGGFGGGGGGGGFGGFGGGRSGGGGASGGF